VKFFVLDDMQERHDWFSKALRGRGTVWHAHTVAEAKVMLDEHRFDVAFLDHDLDCTDHTRDGLHVAQYIAAMPSDERPANVVVHSWNVDGARRMVDAVNRQGVPATYAPFGQEKLSRIVGSL